MKWAVEQQGRDEVLGNTRASGSRIRIPNAAKNPSHRGFCVLLVGEAAISKLSERLRALHVDVLTLRQPLTVAWVRCLQGVDLVFAHVSTVCGEMPQWFNDETCIPECNAIVLLGKHEGVASACERRCIVSLPEDSDSVACCDAVLTHMGRPASLSHQGFAKADSNRAKDNLGEEAVLLRRLINEVANIAMIVQPATAAIEEIAQKESSLLEPLAVISGAFERIRKCGRDVSYVLGGHQEVSSVETLSLLERAIESSVLELAPHQRFLSRLTQGLWPVALTEDELLLLYKCLFDNARRATSGGGHVRIEADNVHVEGSTLGESSPSDGDYVRIRFTDDGFGMSKTVQTQAGQLFFSTWGQNVAWEGLGLAKAHGICRRALGRLSLTSRAGLGTTATAWLRRAATVPEARRPKRPGEGGLGISRFLLVDDEPLILAGLARGLASLGHLVFVAQDAETAELILEEEGPSDYAVIDVHLGRQSGTSLAHALRRRWPNLGIVMTTGFWNEGQGADCFQSKSEAFVTLTKPFGVGELIAQVQQVDSGYQVGCSRAD